MSNNNRILWFLIGLLGGLVICAISVFTLWKFPNIKPSETAKPDSTLIAAPIDTVTFAASTQMPTAVVNTEIPPVTPTFISTNIMVQAKFDTNCRQGPSTSYTVMGLLHADQQSIALGTNNDQSWWYIENPDNPENACWVNGETTELKGDASLLALITPPPPPITGVSFLAAFWKVEDCANNPLAIIQINNTGTEKLESMSIVMIDQTTNDTIFYIPTTNFPFLDNKEPCTIGNEFLAAGKIGIVGGYLGQAARHAHVIRTSIKMCNEDYLSGTCAESPVEFIVP